MGYETKSSSIRVVKRDEDHNHGEATLRERTINERRKVAMLQKKARRDREVLEVFAIISSTI